MIRYGQRVSTKEIPEIDVAFQEKVQAKRIARMEMIDKFPVEIRELVHEYGWSIVHALIDVGVKKPSHIRHVVERVLDEFSPTRGTYSKQGIRTEVDAAGRCGHD
jgi:hypothetical protein